jgi:hypothetical protein
MTVQRHGSAEPPRSSILAVAKRRDVGALKHPAMGKEAAHTQRMRVRLGPLPSTSD